MRKLITLFVALFLICTGSMQAQSSLKVDEIIVINTDVNDVTVQIKTANQGQAVSSRITQSGVNQKTGFTTSFNADNTLLTLNFTRQFNENELSTLLEYSGVELRGTAFNELYNLLNQ